MRPDKLFAIALCAVCFSCADDLTQIGSSVQPDADKIVVKRDTFDIPSQTLVVEKIQNHTYSEWIGAASEGFYGSLKVDFLTQFMVAPEIDFSGGKNSFNVGNKIDSMVLRMRFISFLGDSLAPMQLSVYQLNRQLPAYAFSNLNPLDYYTPSAESLLGRKTYTASDISVEDTIKDDDGYARVVELTLPKTLAQKFYAEYKNHPETFKSKTAFNEFFPGIYVTGTYGYGSLVNFRETTVRFFYTVIKDGAAAKQLSNDYMAVTTEVSNVNRIQQTNLPYMEEQNPDTAYLKAPAGLITEIDFPTQAIIDRLREGGPTATLNGVLFSVPLFATPANGWKIAPPSYLLFIRSSQVDKFFSTSSLYDNKNTFYAEYNSKTQSYNFGNISSFISNILEANPDTTGIQEKISLVPVSLNTISSTLQNIAHTLYPSLGKIDKQNLKVSIVTVKKE